MWMPFLFPAFALGHAAVPPHVDLDDLDGWETSADAILDGPRGCWELVGQASWDWDVGRFGANRGDAVFVGRLEDGVWSELHIESLGEIAREKGKNADEVRQYTDEPRFAPLVGKLHGRRVTVATREGETEVEVDGSDNTPVNLVRGALADLGGRVDTSWTQWDDAAQAVVLHRAVPIGEGSRAPEAKIEVLFPAGERLPMSLDVVFPERFHRGTFPRWKVDDAVVHVRGRVSQGNVFPTMESFRFDFGVLGFKFHGAQTIVYKSARRCPVPVAPKAP